MGSGFEGHSRFFELKNEVRSASSDDGDSDSFSAKLRFEPRKKKGGGRPLKKERSRRGYLHHLY